MPSKPDYEALAEVLLMVHDEPDGLTAAALRKLRDARRAAVNILISSPSAYRDLSPETLARDVERLHTELLKSTVAIAEPDLAKTAAKRAAEAFTLDDYVTPAQAADILHGVDEDDVIRMVTDGILHMAYCGVLIARAEVEERAAEFERALDEAEEWAASQPDGPVTDGARTIQGTPPIVDTAPAAELNDGHAVGDAPPSAWMDRDPVEEIVPGGVYVTEDGEILTGVGLIDAGRYLIHRDGRASLWPEVGPLRLAGAIPATLAEALDIEQALAALTGTRRVPADAIVLPALTTEATAALEAVLDTDLSSDIAATEDENGEHAVTIHGYCCEPCGHVHAMNFTPDEADTYAAHLATVAAEARANAEQVQG